MARFFSLTGSAFAHLGKTTPVPGFETMTAEETLLGVIDKSYELNVKDRLRAFSIAAEMIYSDRKIRLYHLIVLNLAKNNVTINSYSKSNLNVASKDYGDVEQRIAGGEQMQAVLVSAGDIDNLRRAYPNYFLDTHEFIRHLDKLENFRKRTLTNRPT